MTTLEIQRKLKLLGFYRDNLDGVEGPNTRRAIIGFKRSVGLMARAFVGPITREALQRAQEPPEWIKELNAVYGYHEERDNGVLSRWLASDGAFLGDPDQFPWCGDAVETAIYRALPSEPRFENPYWARNWAGFGVGCGDVYGAVDVFKRGSGGHVGFLVGVSKDGRLRRIRGGNQANEINDVWIGADRLLASRWPSTVPARYQKRAPVLSADGAVVSTNEA